ncbi:MAG: hypothetical protein JNJ41_01975 [Bacteroidia bacterium]|nr:hypothetical protein [Bacteroidia bacterium]
MKNKNNFLGWFLLGLLLVVLWIIYKASQSEKVKNYQDDVTFRREELQRDIVEKESMIGYLITEVEKLRALNDDIIQKSLRFFRWVKISIIGMIIGISIMCYAVFNFSFFEAVFTIITIASLSFNAVCIIVKNKLGDFNLTLQILKEYFIMRECQKNCFEPVLITTFEIRLKMETEQLMLMRTEYNQLLIIENQN